MPVQAPTLPSRPQAPKAPPAPKPGPHHNLPRTIPKGAPAPQPKTQPVRTGPAVAVATLVVLNESNRCQPGVSIRAKKPDYPKNEKPRRRQRPCSGGKPQVEHEEKRRVIGHFSIPAKVTNGPLTDLQKIVRERTEQVAKKAGYEPGSGDMPIHSRLTEAKTGYQKFLDVIAKNCHYEVFMKEKKRKCTCPDGSPCRSTSRK